MKITEQNQTQETSETAFELFKKTGNIGAYLLHKQILEEN